MQTYTMQTCPFKLSKVCLGTASMGADGLSGRPLERAFEILDAYYAIGGRFLDTANVYGRWGVDHTNASEKVIGLWLRERRITDMIVTTKACHYMPESPDISRVGSVSMRNDVEESRTALGLDKLQICLLHRDNELADIRVIVDFCAKMVDEGKIIRFGFSNFSAERVQTAVEYLGNEWNKYFAGVSNEWSLAMDGADGYRPSNGMMATDNKLREVQKTYDFPLFPFSSVAHGFFDKLQKCSAIYDGSWKNTDEFRGNKSWLTAANGAAYNRLCQMSDETGISVNMLSLAYMLAQHNTVPVMSVSRPAQLDELLKVTERSWDSKDFSL